MSKIILNDKRMFGREKELNLEIKQELEVDEGLD